MSNRKQHISFNDTTTDQLEIKCGVPQSSILGPLLFIIVINDLPNASNILDPIIFADDTNLFYSNNNIQDLFSTVNEELKHISTWFHANKLSLNTGKTKYTFFHKSKRRYPASLTTFKD